MKLYFMKNRYLNNDYIPAAAGLQAGATNLQDTYERKTMSLPSIRQEPVDLFNFSTFNRIHTNF